MAKVGKTNKMRRRKSSTKKALTKSQVKAVTAIAKKVDAKQDETKFFRGRYMEALPVPVLNKTITSYNLFYHGVQQGLTKNDVIGDKLNWRGVAVNFGYNPNALYGGNENWRGHILHVGIIACRTFKTLTSLTFADIQDPSMQIGADAGFIEPGQAQWLVHKKIPIRPRSVNTSAATQNSCDQVQGRIWLRRNQMVKFKDLLQSHELDNKFNYYFVHYAVGENCSTGAGSGGIKFQYKVYFKDA